MGEILRKSFGRDAMEFGIIGLGRMGANLARQAVERGIRVVGFSRTRKEDLLKEGIELASDMGGLQRCLALHGSCLCTFQLAPRWTRC